MRQDLSGVEVGKALLAVLYEMEVEGTSDTKTVNYFVTWAKEITSVDIVGYLVKVKWIEVTSSQHLRLTNEGRGRAKILFEFFMKRDKELKDAAIKIADAFKKDILEKLVPKTPPDNDKSNKAQYN